MSHKLENTSSPEELQEFDINTLYIYILSAESNESTLENIALASSEELNQTLMNRIADGFTRVEAKNEVGSLYPHLDVLLCPSGTVAAVNGRNLKHLEVYLNDILLANDSYHKKSIIRVIALDKKTIITEDGKKYLNKVLSPLMEKRKEKVKEVKF